MCIGRNPSLEIEYKTIKENRTRLPNLRQQIKKINFSSEDENDADLSSSSTPEKIFALGKNKRTIRKRSRPSMSESVKSATIKKRRGRPKEKPDDYDDEATEDEIETSGFVPTLNDCTAIGIDEQAADGLYAKKAFRNQMMNNSNSGFSRNNNSSSNNNSFVAHSNDGGGGGGGGSKPPCGACEGCKVTNHCGKCDLCKKYGGSINSRFTCRKRLCLRERKGQHQFYKDYTAL